MRAATSNALDWRHSVVIRSKPGMQRERHRTLSAAGVTFVRADPELVERVLAARKRRFDTDQLPNHLRYTVEEYES